MKKQNSTIVSGDADLRAEELTSRLTIPTIADRLCIRHSGFPLAVALLVVGLGTAIPAPGEPVPTSGAHSDQSKIRIPEALHAEHAEIHAQLVAATKVPGVVGEAARKLAAILAPHFQREEEMALPPLGLLAPLSRGGFTPEMREVLVMTDALRAELPHMLEEHKAILAATLRLGEVAKAEGNATVQRLTETLQLHAQNEEQVSYPAALLVGEIVRARLASIPRDDTKKPQEHPTGADS